MNIAERLALRVCFGPLQPGKQLFRFDLDPYDRSARFVNTHLLAKELTEPALLEAFRAGRAFVAFNMLADATGFAYIAESNGHSVTMGDSMPLSTDLTLKAEAPLPCKYTLMCNGKQVDTQEGKSVAFSVKHPGKYRVQADLKILGSWNPWIVANPIEVTTSTP